MTATPPNPPVSAANPTNPARLPGLGGRLGRGLVIGWILAGLALALGAPLATPFDTAALAKAAGEIGTTIFHPVGTAKMGLASDRLADCCP